MASGVFFYRKEINMNNPFRKNMQSDYRKELHRRKGEEWKKFYEEIGYSEPFWPVPVIDDPMTACYCQPSSKFDMQILKLSLTQPSQSARFRPDLSTVSKEHNTAHRCYKHLYQDFIPIKNFSE